MIPYIMHRDMGYEAIMICYKNGDYPYLDEEVPGLRMQFMNKGWYHIFHKAASRAFAPDSIPLRLIQSLCTALDTTSILVRDGRKISVLQLYHMKDESIAIGWIYRLINPKGKLYLKLDLNPVILDLYRKDPGAFNRKIPFLYDLVQFDIITVESQKLYEFIRSKLPYYIKYWDKVFYLPNGVDHKKLPVDVPPIENRENIILHIGRLGNIEKRTEVVLEAFAAISDEFPTWKLVLAGIPETGFMDYYYNFMNEHNSLKGRVLYVGYLKIRKVIDWYLRSKILAFPSRHESFGLVVAEAGACGVVPVGTLLPSLIDLTDNELGGYLCPVDDTDCFINKLKYAMSHEDELQEKSDVLKNRILEHFEWGEICVRLHELICNAG
jgi:glycosyltransferase involved in cell wall biosynthesis